jgi:hypothetical protein
MMYDDPIAVLLRRTIEASLAGPMVALQNRFSMSAEVFAIVMLAGQTAMAHATGDDVERATGAEEDRLNSFAARPGGEVCEWRIHLETLIVAGSWQGCALETRPAKSRDFANSGAFAPKKTRWEGV